MSILSTFAARESHDVRSSESLLFLVCRGTPSSTETAADVESKAEVFRDEAGAIPLLSVKSKLGQVKDSFVHCR